MADRVPGKLKMVLLHLLQPIFWLISIGLVHKNISITYTYNGYKGLEGCLRAWDLKKSLGAEGIENLRD